MTRKTRNRAGVIGLGQIGSKIASGLRGGGFSVYVWNRSPRAEPNFLGSAVEVADLCDVIQLFVPDAQALNEVVRTLCAALRPQHVVLGHATVSPQVARAVGTIVESAGARYLDAPIVGTRADAAARKLVYYIGGREDALRDVRTVLQTTARRILHVGGIGDASMLKLATQTLSAVTVQAVAEMHALAKAGGLSDELLLDALEDDPARSALAAEKLEAITTGQFNGGPPVRHTLTGLRLALAGADDGNLQLPAAAIAAGALQRAMERGQGQSDAAIVARGIEPRAAATLAPVSGGSEVAPHSDTPASESSHPPMTPPGGAEVGLGSEAAADRKADPPASGPAKPTRETKRTPTKTKPVKPPVKTAPVSAEPPAPGSAKARLAAATAGLKRLFERPLAAPEPTAAVVPVAAPAPPPLPPPLPASAMPVLIPPAAPEPSAETPPAALPETALEATAEPAEPATPTSLAEDKPAETAASAPPPTEIAEAAVAGIAATEPAPVDQGPPTADPESLPSEPETPPSEHRAESTAERPPLVPPPLPAVEPRPLEIPVVQQSVPAPPVHAMRPFPSIRPVEPLPPFRPFSKRTPAAESPATPEALAPLDAAPAISAEPTPAPPPAVPLPPFPVAPPEVAAALTAATQPENEPVAESPAPLPEPTVSPTPPRPAAPLLAPALESPRPLVPLPPTLVAGLGEVPARPLTLPPVAPPRPSERVPIIPLPLKPKSPTARIPFPMPPVPRPPAPPPPIVGKTDASGRFRLETRERPPTNRVPISTTTFPLPPPPKPSSQPPPPPTPRLTSSPTTGAEEPPRAPVPTVPVSSPMFLRRPRGESGAAPILPPIDERPVTQRVPLPPPPDDEPVSLPPVETPLAWDDSPEPDHPLPPKVNEPAPILERAPFQAFRGTNFIPYAPDSRSAEPVPGPPASGDVDAPAGEWQLADEEKIVEGEVRPADPTEDVPAEEVDVSTDTSDLDPTAAPAASLEVPVESETAPELEPEPEPEAEPEPEPMLVREIVTEVMPPAHVPTGHTRPTPIVVPGEIRPIERVVSGSKAGGGRVSEPPRKRSWIRKLFGV